MDHSEAFNPSTVRCKRVNYCRTVKAGYKHGPLLDPNAQLNDTCASHVTLNLDVFTALPCLGIINAIYSELEEAIEGEGEGGRAALMSDIFKGDGVEGV